MQSEEIIKIKNSEVTFIFIGILAHLSRRLIWWAYRIGRPLSSVVRRRRPHSLNIFSSETTGPIKVKFHMELLWDGKRKFAQMFMVTWPRWPPCPYMVKTLKKSSSLEPKGQWPWNGMQHRVLEYYQVCSNDDPELTLTYFTARSNLVSYAFIWEKGKTMDFSDTIVVYDVKVGRCS